MALGFYLVHEGLTPEKYSSAIKQLEAAGAGAPKGRTFHVALESNGAIQVFDIWDSQEDMLMAGLGSIVAMICVYQFRKRRARASALRELEYAGHVKQ